MTETLAPPLPASTPARLSDYLELTKPRLSMLSVATTLVGYFAARPGWFPVEFLFLVLGTCCAAAGVAVLNQWIETDTDGRMRRTADRPLPTGRIASGSAFVLGAGLCCAGLAFIFAQVNGLAAFFTLLTIFSYLALYTPAKRTSRWSTEIGAIAGAFPPLIGWAAGEGSVSALGWILFAVLFFWQIPHFMAVAWTYREDYSAVNFPMLPVRDASGRRVAAWSLFNTGLLLAVCALPTFLQLASGYYLAATALLGLWFLHAAWRFQFPRGPRNPAARRLFFVSIGWLPLQLGLLVADRYLLAP